ncbi:MAG TPA: hypothetical protein VH063_07190 [Gaiellaceae bacterium]|nr:hypothetical protein [Gaiellaceae bacterium]
MIARVASFEGVNVEAAQSSMDEAEAVIRPMLAALAGYSGGLELFAENGKFLSISLFDSVENAQAAEPTFDQEMPEKLGRIFQQWEGTRVSVDLYHVAGDDRR